MSLAMTSLSFGFVGSQSREKKVTFHMHIFLIIQVN